MKYLNAVLMVLLIVVLGASFRFYKNPTFEHYDTFNLFPEDSNAGITWEVVTDSASSDNQWPYKRVKFTNTGADTIISQPITNRSGYAFVSIHGEPIGATINVDIYVGQFVGRAVGDTLGMKWYKLTTETSTFNKSFNLNDSTWFGGMAHPYSMIKIVEKAAQQTQFVIDWISYKNY